MKQPIQKRELPVSTRRMISNNKPIFPLGSICGKYWRYPIGDGDVEGGLRLNGCYKENTSEYPLITYITVVYNRYKTLAACMASVWMQTYPNIEYIIVDGGSKDGTRELILDNQDKIDYFISQKDKGIYDAMNKGIALASGQYICFMNSDDVCLPTAAEKVVGEIRRTGADLICGSRELWQDGKKQDEITYLRLPIKKCVFRYLQMYHQATYASRKAFDTVGYFDMQYKLLADWVWESQCIDAGLTVDFFEAVLTRFHYDGASYLGMEIRDADWIRWITNTFPSLSYRDAETLLFALDQYREPYFEVSTLLPVVKKYKQDKDFLRCFYETVLLRIIDEAYDIVYFNRTAQLDLDLGLNNYKTLPGKYSSCRELSELIDAMIMGLKENCFKSNVDVSLKDIGQLNQLKKTVNLLFDHTYCKLYIGKERCSWFKKARCLPLYTMEKAAAKSIYLSRELFRIKRTRMIKKAKVT